MELWQLAIVTGVVAWDGAVLWWIIRHARPSWRRKLKVQKAYKTRITYDRNEWGNVVNYEHESD